VQNFHLFQDESACTANNNNDSHNNNNKNNGERKKQINYEKAAKEIAVKSFRRLRSQI